MADNAFTLTEEKMEEMKQEFLGGTTPREDSYVRFSEDKTEAFLYLAIPLEPQKRYETEQLCQLLKEAGVLCGYFMPRLVAMAKKGVYEREIRVAAGKPVIDGIDGYYEYFFSPEKIQKSPLVREDGSVDYSSMSMLQNVKAGDRIAEYHPAKAGEDGYLIDGTVLKSKASRELPPLRGRSISREGETYFATVDGKVELKNNNIDIKTIHEVNGDVDLTMGRIEFFGDITISGNVGTGVVIRAGRNLVIEGTVENVTLFAGGDIILKRGIQGNQRAKVRARGSVYADFIEHCEVQADGNIQSNYFLNARIVAGEKVIASGKKGSIIGGFIQGTKGVEAGSIGNEVEAKTFVHAGYTKEIYDKYLRCEKEEREIKQGLQELVDRMKEILTRRRQGQSAGSNLPAVNLQALNVQKDAYFKRLDEIKEETEVLQRDIAKGKGAKIFVEGNIYRGSIVSVEIGKFAIQETVRYMFYSYQGGRVLAEHIRRIS